MESTTTSTDVVDDLDNAGELIRAVLHRSMGDQTASDLYRIHGELSVLVPRCAELASRVGDQLARRNQDFQLGHDAGGDVDACVQAHTDHILAATAALEAATRALAAAHSEVSHLSDRGVRRES